VQLIAGKDSFSIMCFELDVKSARSLTQLPVVVSRTKAIDSNTKLSAVPQLRQMLYMAYVRRW